SLVAEVLRRIPEERTDDVIVLDPMATDRPVGLNLLRPGCDEISREVVVDHVIHIWHKLYDEFWGPRTEDLLRGALLTLINSKAANGQACTLMETPALLTDQAFRRWVIRQPGLPPKLQGFWNDYRAIPKIERARSIAPLMNKLRKATLSTPISLMLGQSQGL